MDEQIKNQDEDAWTVLWKETSSGSWDLLGSDSVAEALRQHWLEQIHWIARASRVVDVASGPGVLLRLLRTHGLPNPVESGGERWICVDRAEIPQSSLSDLGGALGAFGVPFENQKSPVGGVDVLLSNFGLEYVPYEYRARSCALWLATGGRLHAVIHAKGSHIEMSVERAISDLTFALHELDISSIVQRAVEAKSTAPADPIARMMHGVEVRDAFNTCINVVKDRLASRADFAGPLHQMLLAVAASLQRVTIDTFTEEALRMSRLMKAYEAELSRLQEMRSVAMDKQTIREFSESLTREGFTEISVSPLTSASRSIGWLLRASRL